MTRVRRSSVILFALVVLFGMGTGAGADQFYEKTSARSVPLTLTDGLVAWSENGDSRHAIFVSRQTGQTWGPPEEISTNTGINVAPAVIGNGEHDALVIWSCFTGRHSQLHFRLYSNGGWGEEIIYSTGLVSNTAPTMLLDGRGRLWLAWAAFNGFSDEIYYSFWQGEGFTEAQPLTTSGIPNTLPILGIDSLTGQIWVQWQRFTETGYLLYESIWTGTSWSEAQAVLVDGQPVNSDQAVELMLRHLAEDLSDEETGEKHPFITVHPPDFVTTPGSAAVHIPGYAVQSLPLRALGLSE